MPDLPVSLDEIRARARAAGLTIAEARLPMVTRLLGEALAAARDPAAGPQPADEPAIEFHPLPRE
jgi:hypothetical protein